MNKIVNVSNSQKNLAPWIIGASVLVAAILIMAAYLNRSEFDDSSAAMAHLASTSKSSNSEGGDVVGGPPTNIAHTRPAPLFELPTPDGKTWKLESFKGNAVVVHFWASWCPPCLGEIPHWLDFAAKWRGRPVKFVAVSLDKAWPEALKILPAANLPENTVSVLDQGQTLPDLFGTYQYPETYLLDPDLRIVSKWVGAQPWESPAIEQALLAVMPKSN